MKVIKDRLYAGESVWGSMISEVACPNLMRIFKVAGFDYVVVDCEHGYFDYSQLAAMASVANGVGLPMLVRIPQIERGVITKVLDMSADGLLVPMVNTVDEAKKIVDYAKYPDLGHRGVSTQRAHTNYNPPELGEYFKIANKRTIIFAQIETREALKNIEGIVNVEGIDAIMIGPNDLSIDLGTPGDICSQEMEQAINKVIKSAKRAGKASGILTSNKKVIRDCRMRGMNVISCDSEVGMLIKAAKKVVESLKELEEG